MKLTTRLIAFALAAVAATGSSLAQTFPDKPIRLIVPFAAGSTSDYMARLVSPKLTELLGQSVVVDNRPGGGGTAATEAVSHMAPDGYNIMMASTAQFVVAPVLQGPKLKYKPESDFTVLGPVARVPTLLLVSAADPAAPKTAAEFISRAKTAQLSYSTTGTGSLTYLTSELLMKRLGGKATHVPYRGSTQSLTDLAAGHVSFAVDSPAAAAPLIQAGRIKPIAILGNQRLASMKDVPTLEELGVKGVVVYTWFALFAPAGLPPAVAQRLRAGVDQAASDPDVKKRLLDLNIESYASGHAGLEIAIREERPVWQKLVDETGIKIE